MMDGAIIGAIAGLGTFVGGLVFHAGQMTQRVASLEQWRAELRQDLQRLDSKLDRIELLIRGEAT
jgi:hypothetical protein